MKVLHSKRIIVGVSGGIAAYKACELIRLLCESGAEVKVILTENAQQFVHKNTFASLTNHTVHDDLFDDPMVHIHLAKWAEIIVIAPATAATLSRLAVGAANDLLSTVCLASSALIYLAPSMNKIMWENSLTQANVATLVEHDYRIIFPEYGAQACGDVGYGRMASPQTILDALEPKQALWHNLNILITAGATREKLDPIRYISNFSSGKMGYALAQTCVQQGAKVILISAPTSLEPPKNAFFIPVTTSDEMIDSTHQHLKQVDIIISVAAIADYKAKKMARQKIKKTEETITLELIKTTDLLTSIADEKLFKVGFCAETENLRVNAKHKLDTKKLNVIIANLVTEEGYPFGAETNAVAYLNAKGDVKELATATKSMLAEQLMALIVADYRAFHPAL